MLGRGSDFDPRLDSTVRVHTGRLRTKLAEYYRTHGEADRVVITVPKGTYHVAWEYRDFAQPVIEKPRVYNRKWLAGWCVAAVALTLAAFAWAVNQPTRVPVAVRSFWRGFTEGTAETLVVFSNPRFVGSAISGMRYAPAGSTLSAADLNDRYTGTGEALALHELTRLFERLRVPMRVKRSLLLTWDEARSRDLVFIGGPDTNLPQGELPRLQTFGFKTSDEAPYLGYGGVVNLKPRAGEERYYLDSGIPVTFDYSVIAMVPGLEPHRRALILAGPTTYGTQAAAEFLVAEDHVRALYQTLGVKPSEPLPFFEALLRVQVSGGVPVQPHLVIVRRRE